MFKLNNVSSRIHLELHPRFTFHKFPNSKYDFHIL